MVDAGQRVGIAGVEGPHARKDAKVSFRFSIEFTQRLQDDLVRNRNLSDLLKKCACFQLLQFVAEGLGGVTKAAHKVVLCVPDHEEDELVGLAGTSCDKRHIASGQWFLHHTGLVGSPGDSLRNGTTCWLRSGQCCSRCVRKGCMLASQVCTPNRWQAFLLLRIAPCTWRATF